MSEFAIEAQDLSKTFRGGVTAVKDLNLKVNRGTVYGLIGRNGAGKTTLLRLLMGLLRPTTGVAKVLGAELMTAPHSVRAQVGYVSQVQRLHNWMTLREISRYVGSMYPTWDRSYAEKLASRFELPWDREIRILSGGEQRKAAILLAFAARPSVLILDEPAGGLDPVARRQLVDEIVELVSNDEDHTILFSTHIISDIERIAEYVGIMEKGQIVMSTPLEDLQKKTKRVQVVFDGDGPPPDFTIPGALHTQISGPVVNAVVKIDHEKQLDYLKQMSGVRVDEFSLGLEEIFIHLFGEKAQRELTEKSE